MGFSFNVFFLIVIVIRRFLGIYFDIKGFREVYGVGFVVKW